MGDCDSNMMCIGRLLVFCILKFDNLKNLKKKQQNPHWKAGVVVYAFTPAPVSEGAGLIQGCPQLYRDFKDNLLYMRLFLTTKIPS